MWRHWTLVGLAGLLLACGPVPQRESLRSVAAIEVPLATPADRADLLALLRRLAAAEGLHVDDGTEAWQRMHREAPDLPASSRGTLYAAVWRGENDEELEVSVGDSGHPGRTWLVFSRGTKPARSAGIRERMLAAVRRRWPEARTVPVLPSGGVPLADDLRLTPQGYRIARARAAGYGLAADSPLLTPR